MHTFKLTALSFFLIFSLMTISTPASVYAQDDMENALSVALVKGSYNQDSKHYQAGIDIKLGDGWHTYWHTPGEAGLPPRFEWDTSSNIKDLKILYPAPKIFDESGFKTFGYEGNVMLPTIIMPNDATLPSTLNMKINIMVCKDICIPKTVEFSMVLNPKESIVQANENRIKSAFTKIPRDKHPELKIHSVVVGQDNIVVSIELANKMQDTQIFTTLKDSKTPSSQTTALTTPQRYVSDSRNENAGMFIIDKPNDIKDMNMYVAGKTLAVLLKNGEIAVSQKIKFPVRDK